MKLPLPIRNISPQRKRVYYAGMALAVIGVVLFLSTFVTFAMRFGNFDNFASNARSDMLRAVVGMILIMGGGIMMGVGQRGLAGSGVLLDPERARHDLEPLARLSGGLTDAAFSEMPTVREAIREVGAGLGGQREVIKVRCRGCGGLNDETDARCGQCGAKM